MEEETAAMKDGARLSLDDELDGTFDLLEVGSTGSVEVIPGRINDDHKKRLKPLTTLPCGLPPLFPPDIKTQLEEYLTNPGKLAVHDCNRTQRFWPRKREPNSLFLAEVCPVQTTLKVERNQTTGELLGYNEVSGIDTGSTARNSMSLQRQPGALSDSVKGSSVNYPFFPGGLDATESRKPNIIFDGEVDFEKDLLDVAPGFKYSVKFGEEERQQGTQPFPVPPVPDVLNVADIFAGTNLEDLEYSEEELEDSLSAQEAMDSKDDVQGGETSGELKRSDSLEHLLVKEEETERKTDPRPAKQQWAFMVDITKPVNDFHKRVPEMAHQWDFEPDTFQKQAIIRLETHDSVFVAAHTSAGKTAVAEYAIALSHQHRTRTVYTSPIKALSNQKFRDFKKTLCVSHPGLDVGLLTGDVQIKPEASCLIMTTEILRSMLYNGSDVIRDVEWVIFDEVHYINDAERGVVWEEVLIMLPDHVSIILLSATVPNTLEFADWIGRTKRKRIYVISTVKRPVPLEHFLYTGNSNKTSNELFLLVDHNSKFLTRGYQAAMDAKKERASKGKDAYGAKGARSSYNPKADRNVWLSLVTMLEKKDKLPMVAFTFSRKKCEENADALSNLNLTTSVEKSRIQVQMQKYLSRLKGADKTLPQVTRMKELLKRGIGVHHSGILPILKELIEILFQEGLVKLLYATETFAMGVNMPARTVVFDSTRKHDGSSLRDLLTGEYIQMAGRAGRRGKDLTGTVIILCKGDVPEASDLHKMMLGKPTTLVSQFRLTYSMILNLLRVEQLRVEDMMKRSFSEFHQQRDANERRQEAEELERKLESVQDVDCVLCSEDMKSYYKACRELNELNARIMVAVFTSPHGQKALSPGRIVVVDTADHKNALAVVLKAGFTPYQALASIQSSPASQSAIDKMFTVLVLCEANSVEESCQEISKGKPSDDRLQPYVRRCLFQPEGRSAHRILHVLGSQIVEITVRTMKIEGDKITDDFRKRMQPRFRGDPPCRSAITAEQELLRLTEANPGGLETMDPIKDFNIRDLDMVDVITRHQSLVAIMGSFSCIQCPSFKEHFFQVRDEMVLRDNLDHIKYLLSDQSLQLLPEYHQRIEVLRKLRYIDASNRVELKGRVACEMSNHELMMTELVFQSTFTDLHHTEIVALLSCFVFQQRRCSEPHLTAALTEGKERIVAIAEAIAAVQNECGLNTPSDEYKEQFYFGLVEAVYEWSRGMPFAEITTLTDVQEGVIVRCIQRLHETCLNVRNAARIIGDPTLYQKMDEASTAIKRDIVFAASLYTQ